MSGNTVDDVDDLGCGSSHQAIWVQFAAPARLPAFVDVTRGHLCLLLACMTKLRGPSDARRPGAAPGGWNRLHFIVDDIESEVARLRDAGGTFRNDIVTGPGGKQILLEDPSGNVIELFQPAER